MKWLFYVQWKIRLLPGKIKRRIWNKHVLLWWNRLWIRKDEFHRSLDLDVEAMFEMNKKEQTRYLADITRRREIAHKKTF